MTDETLFAAALEHESPEAQAAFVDGACDGPEQRARVESLLAAHEQAGSFLDRPAVGADDDSTRATPADDGGTRTFEPAGDPSDADATAFLAPSDRPDSLGRIGHYEVLEVLGRGGFGIVFRAFDDILQRVVAVKVLAPHMAVTSPARKRFLREARSSAAVRHENVVQVHEVKEQPLPYLVMEYIPGETLQQRLDRTGPLDTADALRIGRQIADGLAAAHAQGLIHRDIKPSNILIDAGPHPAAKITDFGLARAADDASLTRSGAVAGTPMYMAPEQARGETLDHRADLFSLGSVLYVMLSGRPPFRANSTPAVLKRVADDTPRPIREIIPEVPEWFCRIVDKLHAKDPAERFQTAQEVADLLADCEKQIAAHGSLQDHSRIPGGEPARGLGWAWAWAVVGVILVLVLLNAAFAGWQEEWNGIQSMQYATVIGILIAVLGVGAAVWSRRVARRGDRLRAGRWRALTVAACVLMVGNVGVGVYKASRVADHIRDTLRPDGGGVTVPPEPVGPATPSAMKQDDGFTPLFNGKDLTGWKTHPDQPGGWEVRDGVLVGSGEQSHLFTQRGDFADFHLFVEARINLGGDSGVFFRSPFGLKRRTPTILTPDGYELELHKNYGHPTKTGGIPKIGPFTDDSLVKPDQWFTLELIARGNRFVTKLDGKQLLACEDATGKSPSGHLALQLFSRGTVVEFRKVEIKELPASPPAVPKTAAEVLPFLAGNWKVELHAIDPKVPPDASPTVGQMAIEYVADGKVLRACTAAVGATGETRFTRFLYSFDADKGVFRQWQVWSDGKAHGPFKGLFNPDNCTLLWRHTIGNGIESINQFDFVDSNTIRTRLVHQDASDKVVREMRMTFTRMEGPAALAALPTDPTRPPEMAVLDRMVGEWRNEQTVTDAAEPGKPKSETCRVKAGLILGGRFVEEQVTNATTGVSDYSLSWFDPAAKAYRRWYFSGTGNVSDLTGAWDDAAKAITWTAADKRTVVVETFTGDGRSDFRITQKDGGGQAVKETKGVARRVVNGSAPKPADIPFDDKQAKVYQQEWATHVNEKVEFTDSKLGMAFRVIPPGEFLMGSAERQLKGEDEGKDGGLAALIQRGYDAEAPPHKVRITRPFAVGKCEVIFPTESGQ